MQNRDNAMGPLLMAAAAAIVVALVASRGSNSGRDATVASAVVQPAGAVTSTAKQPGAQPAAVWAASAPGRVEPNGGEVRVSALSGGRVADVMVKINQKVVAGDLLVRLEDNEIEARIAAADAEASVRRRDRDLEKVTGAAVDRRKAEDAAFDAERRFSLNRATLDEWLFSRREGRATDEQIATVRDTVVKARDAMNAARAALRRSLADTTVAQTRLESALATSRAELAAVDATLERMRIRATQDATVLQISAIQGESVAPSPENVLLVLGDVSKLRVKAEIEERDIGKIRLGQSVVVRSDAFPGRDFEGKVASFAQALGPTKLGQKSPRKLADVDVLEVTIDVVGQSPLLPGMRVDAFFKPEPAAQAKTN